MKVKLKAKDISKEESLKVVDIINKIEERFPNLELVHIYGSPKNSFNLFDIEEEKYITPLLGKEFIKALSEELKIINLGAFASKNKIIIDPIGSRKSDFDEPNTKGEEINSNEEVRTNEASNEEDSQYAYGTVTEAKLNEFIRRYGSYLRDETAELIYNRTKSKWGPKFGYKRDVPEAPTDDIKEEIKEYIANTFYQ